jgi:tetratricopeptide (TPR) repeat protein
MTFALSRRRLLPKWRSVSTTLGMAESQALARGSSRPLNLDSADLEKVISAWRNNPTAGHFGDVLAFSISVQHKHYIRRVAEEAIKDGRDLSPAQLILVNKLIDGASELDPMNRVQRSAEQMSVRIRETRRIFNADPSNPLTLLDMAQLRLALGDAKICEKYIRSARQISPSNRLVLRTFARYLAHVGRPEEGHALLANHERTAHDPWLMASEIAMSQVVGNNAKSIRVGQRLLKEKTLTDANATELAGALAGVEMSHGNYKRAREYFRMALMAPNDNVMAQLVTDQKSLSIDASASIDGSASSVNPYEARALLAWGKVDFDSAFICGLKWHSEEPFSSRPLQFLTSFLSASARYDDAIVLARRGLVADPNDVGLGVNLSYALASTNKLEEAEKIARRAILADPRRFAAQATATMGLIAMKRGDFTRADACYLSALESFSKRGDRELHAICSAYYARTAYDCRHSEVNSIIKAAVDEYKKIPLPDSAFILKGLGAEISAAQRETGGSRMVQWEFDKERLELVRRTVLVDASSPIIVSRKGRSK